MRIHRGNSLSYLARSLASPWLMLIDPPQMPRCDLNRTPQQRDVKDHFASDAKTLMLLGAYTSSEEKSTRKIPPEIKKLI